MAKQTRVGVSDELPSLSPLSRVCSNTTVLVNQLLFLFVLGRAISQGRKFTFVWTKLSNTQQAHPTLADGWANV